MKFLTTGAAVALFCVPTFAQSGQLAGGAISPFPNSAQYEHNARQTQAIIKRTQPIVNPNSIVGTIAKQGVYGDAYSNTPSGYDQTTTVVVAPGYGYGYGYPANNYPAYGYGGYPAYGYPYPYPAPYGYPYPYPYPNNQIVTAPLAPPHHSWDRPAYITSIPLGTTYYHNGAPYYPNPSYGYGSYSRQSSGVGISIGRGNVRVNAGSSKTIRR